MAEHVRQVVVNLAFPVETRQFRPHDLQQVRLLVRMHAKQVTKATTALAKRLTKSFKVRLLNLLVEYATEVLLGQVLKSVNLIVSD